MSDRLYWLAFSAFPGVGPVRFKQILKHFGSARDAWKASNDDLRKAGIGEKLVEKFDRFRKTFSIEGYVKKLKDKEVQFLTLADEDYPKLLKEIKNPPFVLYVKGSREILRSAQNDIERTLAVVGTRKITNYGREVTRMLVSELVNAGFTIVSGLAIGIDAVAHEAAIEMAATASDAGKTIAVLGSGVDVCYPRANERLYEKIIDGNGLVVSEFPLGATPIKGSFPSRNRIIAGLSLGVLVTEGAEDSGALITADYAFKFNRQVFAVPGPITSGLSKGPHKLIEKGARLVTSGEDIIQGLGLRVKGTSSTSPRLPLRSEASRRAKGETKEEEIILKILENEDLHIDEIIRRSGFNTAKMGSLLSFMEVKGVIQGLGGGVFGISR